MEQMLSMRAAPVYLSSSFRQFHAGEHHVTRRIAEDVLLLMLDGVLRFEEEGDPVSLTGGEWYIQRADLRQTGIAESDIPFYFYLHFHGETGFFEKEAMPLRGRFSAQLLLPLLRRLDELERRQLFCGFQKETLFLQILDILGGTHTPGEDTPVMAMVRYLSEHVAERAGLDVLSRRFGYSRDHIIRLFRRELGVTPHQYVLDLRVNHAKLLLSSTNRAVSLVAADCGFEDESSFYRAFRQKTGVPPGSFRRSATRS